ncbi:uncharacterized protein PAN0_003d1757 [Moesziomyces antarcticus]|uniref:Mig1 protein n=1 Tax=Pseudozyma antarctica TaxID=84753 RepID=A0A5C3FIC1_PSEA2|nr:uncharacterized protein PAN0_003d1757 [Moesziomyces antarcticus]GAK63552.1 conserved hypothetical protein [Moesziomyces antarcticus]SPO44142.1 uncharacterized protein PSANT_01827 [Moesziomyces antarcticus]
MFLKQLLLGLGLCAGLAAADNAQTPLTVNNFQYEQRCGANSDPVTPCFTFLGGDLKDVHAEIYAGGAAGPTTDLLLKDDQMRDFTTVNPNKSFTIYWRAFDVSLLYSPIDTSKACYRIQINSPGNGRIWVNDGLNGEGIDLDSRDGRVGFHDFCSKWLRIHVGNDK